MQFNSIETAEGALPSFAEAQIVAAEMAVHNRMGVLMDGMDVLMDEPSVVDSIVTSEGNLPAFETEE